MGRMKGKATVSKKGRGKKGAKSGEPAPVFENDSFAEKMALRKNQAPARRRAVGKSDRHSSDDDSDLDEHMYDEVDAFHSERSRVMLDKARDDEESGVSDDEFDLDGDMSASHGMNLPHIPDSDDEDEDEDDLKKLQEEEEAEEEAERKTKAERDEKNILQAWGKRKGLYYGGDAEDFELMGEDEDTYKDEEKEALRMQRERAEELDLQDFEADMIGSLIQQETKSDGKLISASSSSSSAVSDAALLASLKLKDGLDDISFDLNAGAVSVESVSKDLSSLSAEDKRRHVQHSAPELDAVASDIKACLALLRDEVAPLYHRVRKAQLHHPTKPVSYLSTLHTLLAHHLTLLSFYLYLKAQPNAAATKNHPIAKQIDESRQLLSQMEPVRASYFAQIQRSLASSSSSSSSAAPSSSSTPTTQPVKSQTKSKSQPKSKSSTSSSSSSSSSSLDKAKPKQVKRARDDDDDDEDDEDLEMNGFDEDGEDDDDDDDEGEIDDETLRALMAEHNGQAKRGEHKSAANANADAGMKKPHLINTSRADAELAQFLRANNRKPKSKKSSGFSFGSSSLETLDGLDDVADFADFDNAREMREDADLAFVKGKKSGKDGKKVDPTLAKMAAMASSMEDMDMFGGDEGDGLGDDDDEEAAKAFYERAKQQSRDKKTQHKAQHPIPESKMAAEDPDQVDEDSRRNASRQILKNVGLKRYRPKDGNNPRKRMRGKFEKAQIKHRAVVQQFKGHNPAYAGEATGLNARTVKSVKVR